MVANPNQGRGEIGSDPYGWSYDSNYVSLLVAVVVMMIVVLLLSLPTILLGLEVVSSKGARVAVIVVANMVLAVALIASGVQIGYAIGVIMAFSAVMVNVDV